MAVQHVIKTQNKGLPTYFKPVVLTPFKAIRAMCILCKEGHRSAVDSCEDETCPLFPFRIGNHPERHALSPERLQAILEPSTATDK
jgi:hypothetical protein